MSAIRRSAIGASQRAAARAVPASSAATRARSSLNGGGRRRDLAPVDGIEERDHRVRRRGRPRDGPADGGGQLERDQVRCRREARVVREPGQPAVDHDPRGQQDGQQRDEVDARHLEDERPRDQQDAQAGEAGPEPADRDEDARGHQSRDDHRERQAGRVEERGCRERAEVLWRELRREQEHHRHQPGHHARRPRRTSRSRSSRRPAATRLRWAAGRPAGPAGARPGRSSPAPRREPDPSPRRLRRRRRGAPRRRRARTGSSGPGRCPP